MRKQCYYSMWTVLLQEDHCSCAGKKKKKKTWNENVNAGFSHIQTHTQSPFSSTSNDSSIPIHFVPLIPSVFLDDSFPSAKPSSPQSNSSHSSPSQSHSPQSSHSNSSSTHLDIFLIQVHHEPDDEFLQDVLEVQDDPPILDINLRRSTRVHKSPSYHKSDHCNQVTSSSSTLLHQVLPILSLPFILMTTSHHLINPIVIPFFQILNLPIITKLLMILNGNRPWLLR